MSVFGVPRAVPIVVIDHNRVDVVHRTEVFASPLERSQLLMHWVAGFEATALPFSNHKFGLNRLELIKNLSKG